MKSQAAVRSRGLSATVQLWVLCLVCSMAKGGEPAQMPLLNRQARSPAPNVMITVDDSGSMQLGYLPEGPHTVNGAIVTFPAQYGSAPSFYFMAPFVDDPTHTAYLGGLSPYTVLASKGSASIYQRQMRSPHVNRLYYNPAVRYLPWAHPDGGRYADADATAVLWDPVNPAMGHFDVRSNLLDWWNAPKRRWCTGPGTCPESQQPWYPGLYYLLRSGADPTLAGSYEEFDVNDAGRHAPPFKSPARTDCAGPSCTAAEEQQNHANWAQYHRSRMLMTKAVLSEVLAMMNPEWELRLGLASLHTVAHEVDGLWAPVIRRGIRPDSVVQRSTLLRDIQSLQAWAETPLKQALTQVGRYFTLGDDADSIPGARSTGSPWRTDPGGGGSPLYQEMLSCRRAHHLVLSDGAYEVDTSFLPGNVDGLTGPTNVLEPDMERRYPGLWARIEPALPLSDAYSNTLADLAMVFYVRDLAPALPNRVAPLVGEQADPASWQHLVQTVVGLGVFGSLPSRTAEQRRATLDGIRQGRLTWPNPGTGTEPKPAEQADDLFHATVNTGGDFFSAHDGPELTAALRQALARSRSEPAVVAGEVLSGRSWQPSLKKFVSVYRPDDWRGDLLAYGLAPATSGGRQAFRRGQDTLWVASSRRPAWDQRRIMTWDAARQRATPFNREMPTSIQAKLGAVADAPALIDYLRGDSRNEGSQGLQFRDRDGAQFGDFVNSAPVYVPNVPRMAYADAGYAQFVADKGQRAGLVALGGGDGMLHVFAASDGQELFAYVPSGVLSNLSALADPDYGSRQRPHHHFVDGPMTEADVLLNQRWRSVLVGTLGSGGRGVFALDLTDPSQLGTSSVLWDKSSDDDADLGYVGAAPEVGRVQGRWMAFFGNGSHSDAGRAVLYAVDLEDGHLQRLVIDNGPANGLMGVKLLRNRSQDVVAAYAGDLSGRLWRVDLESSVEAADWRISFGGKPLFIARDDTGVAQAITAKPALATHHLGGRVVLFGTGRLLDGTDTDDMALQTFYGVWDPTPDGASAADGTAPWHALGNQREALQVQAVEVAAQSVVQPDGATRSFHATTARAINWGVQRGWYMDLRLGEGAQAKAEGHRVLAQAELMGEFVWVSAVRPGSEPQPCQVGDSSTLHLMLLAVSGQRFDKPVLDVNGDGLIDTRDGSLNAYETASVGPLLLLRHSATGASGDPGGSALDDISSIDWQTYCVNLSCRITDRVWKQIISPPQPH